MPSTSTRGGLRRARNQSAHRQLPRQIPVLISVRPAVQQSAVPWRTAGERRGVDARRVVAGLKLDERLAGGVEDDVARRPLVAVVRAPAVADVVVVPHHHRGARRQHVGHLGDAPAVGVHAPILLRQRLQHLRRRAAFTIHARHVAFQQGIGIHLVAGVDDQVDVAERDLLLQSPPKRVARAASDSYAPLQLTSARRSGRPRSSRNVTAAPTRPGARTSAFRCDRRYSSAGGQVFGWTHAAARDQGRRSPRSRRPPASRATGDGGPLRAAEHSRDRAVPDHDDLWRRHTPSLLGFCHLQKSYKRKALLLLLLWRNKRLSPRTLFLGHISATVTASALEGRYSKISWVTCFFMTLFHIGAVWALFQFTWSGLAVLLVTYYVSLALGIGMSYHRLLTHRSYKTSKGDGVFPHHLRHAGARGRSALLGGGAPPAPSAFGHGQRSAHAGPRRLLGAHGLDHVRRGDAQRHRVDVKIRARPGEGSLSTSG